MYTTISGIYGHFAEISPYRKKHARFTRFGSESIDFLGFVLCYEKPPIVGTKIIVQYPANHEERV